VAIAEVVAGQVFRGLKGAFIPIGGLTSGFPHQGSLGSGGQGVPCGPTMLRKQVTRPGRSQETRSTKSLVTGPIRVLCPTGLDPLSWPRRRRRSSELEERPSHGPDPRLPCPTR
jgi:hypothetical protein